MIELIKTEEELDEAQLNHLNFLKKRFEFHGKSQMYPFTFALEDWVNSEGGADLEDREFTIIINLFTVWALKQVGEWSD